MLLHSFSIDGLSALPHFEWHIDAQDTRFAGPTPESSALRDALELSFAVFSPEKMTRLLNSWGWMPKEVHQEGGRVVEAYLENPNLVTPFILEQPQPTIKIQISLGLSADILAKLRRWTVRSPELQFALLEDPMLRLTLSFDFGLQRKLMRITVGGIHLGAEKIDLSTDPHWLPQLWHQLQHVFSSIDPQWDLAQLAAEAAFSVEQHHRYLQFRAALPELSPLRLIQVDSQWRFWVDEQPLRAFGDKGILQIQHAALLYLSGASIVWLEGPCACVENDAVQVWGTEVDAAEVKLAAGLPTLASFSKR